MQIICAFDSYKGCMTATEACHVAAVGMIERLEGHLPLRAGKSDTPVQARISRAPRVDRYTQMCRDIHNRYSFQTPALAPSYPPRGSSAP